MLGIKLSSFVNFALLGSLAILSGVNAHGHIFDPPARQESCARCKDWGSCSKEVFTDYCDGVQYEPQSVEALKGAPFPREVGEHICNGNGTRFDGLNEHNATLWPRKVVYTGQDVNFTWHFKMSHKTTGYSYFVTRDSWDQEKNKRLTKDDFESIPIHTEPGHEADHGNAPRTHTIPGKKFSGHVGYVIILGVWTIDDTANAFYNCIDLEVRPESMEGIYGSFTGGRQLPRGQAEPLSYIAAQFGGGAFGAQFGGHDQQTFTAKCTIK